MINNCEALRMDFKEKGLHPLPFYMAYPGYLGPKQENAALQDLEYLQQTYPQEVKRYQCKIAEILDKLDYEGSMIYDEYPDQYSLRRMSETIIRILKQEEQEKNVENPLSEEGWKLMNHMIQVLLCDEIYKRRHGGKRGRALFPVFGKF